MHHVPFPRDLRSAPMPRAAVPLWAILLGIVLLQAFLVGVFVRLIG